jgi:hypothetical protein
MEVALRLEFIEGVLPPVLGDRLRLLGLEESLEVVKVARLQRVRGTKTDADQVNELIEVRHSGTVAMSPDGQLRLAEDEGDPGSAKAQSSAPKRIIRMAVCA